MIDINLIRTNPELVKQNIKKKFKLEKLPLVDKVLKADMEHRKLLAEVQQLRHKRNEVSEKINQLKKAGKDAKAEIKKAKELPGQIARIEERIKALEVEIREAMLSIPNIIHESVPLGKDATQNKEIKKIGKPKEFDFPAKNHVELAENLGIVDFDASAKTTGKGFFYLKGALAQLNQALIGFSINFMMKRGYTLVEPPLMIKKNICEGVVDFEFFKNMVYKIQDEDLYLIGTSEHPLIGMFINKTIDEKELPIRIVGLSQCFRKEIGSHGIDEKGLFRTHQFNKVEQVVICKPKDSYKMYDEMMKNSVDLFKELGIPTRIFECCSGDLADLKAKSADLEAWSPKKKEYYEIGSCSNLTDAQARRLNIKATNGKEKYLVHTLNNTAVATSRAMVAILENYQNEDGSITIPKVLVPYMGGMTKIEKKK